MQSAGRILLMPKGDYSAGTTYTMLDLVNHSGASWVCKKECTGQEPSDSNTEFWQRFGTAVDMSHYLPKTGGTVSGNITVGSDDVEGYKSSIKNANRIISQWLMSNGLYVFYDETNGKNIISSSADGKNTFDGTASGNLPLSGGGTVSSNNDTPVTLKSNTSKNVYQRFVNSEGAGWYFGFDEKGARIVGQGYLLHTGNKPTGTYTGNGDATSRTIAIDGIGETLRIFNTSYGIAFIGKYGGVGIGADGNTIITSGECKFENGVLTMASTSKFLNANTYVYEYDLL